MKKLYAISDLHISMPKNLAMLQTLTPHPDDWIILAGDICETTRELQIALDIVCPKFQKVLWVPGNHELWTTTPGETKGQEKYLELVSCCRKNNVLTPEDEYPLWETDEGSYVIAPLFILYDYTFRPQHIKTTKEAIVWAMEEGLLCRDEAVLFSSPYASRELWCEARCVESATRLNTIPQDKQTILINHFPLRADLAVLPAIPRFSIWCGTTRTEDWHKKYRAKVVVSGHLHIRSTQWRHGVRFEEVSLGYPKQWSSWRTIDSYLRQILP